MINFANHMTNDQFASFQYVNDWGNLFIKFLYKLFLLPLFSYIIIVIKLRINSKSFSLPFMSPPIDSVFVIVMNHFAVGPAVSVGSYKSSIHLCCSLIE